MLKKLALLAILAFAGLNTAWATSVDNTTPLIKPVTTAYSEEIPTFVKHLDLVLILDKSGSMYGLEKDTIGGYNSMVEKEKALDIDTKVTTVLFNDKSSTLFDRQDITTIPLLTTKDYYVGGMTALLDAVGNTITKLDAQMPKNDKTHQVIFVIITDGQENASQEYTKPMIKKLIADKQEQGWKFIFLGANIDAVSEAQKLGIDSNNAVKYRNTATGVQKNFAAIAAFTRSVIEKREADTSWKDEIEQDK